VRAHCRRVRCARRGGRHPSPPRSQRHRSARGRGRRCRGAVRRSFPHHRSAGRSADPAERLAGRSRGARAPRVRVPAGEPRVDDPPSRHPQLREADRGRDDGRGRGRDSHPGRGPAQTLRRGAHELQLVEVTTTGAPSLELLVHPALGRLDDGAVRNRFLESIAALSPAGRVASLRWRAEGLPRIERRPPLATGTGKILHVHQRGRAGPR
jgi:hypothetical protein